MFNVPSPPLPPPRPTQFPDPPESLQLSTTNNEEQLEKQILDEQALNLKATVTQPLSLVIVMLPLLGYYAAGSYTDHLTTLLDGAFNFPELLLNFSLMFSWDFDIPYFGFKMAMNLSVFGIGLVGPLFRKKILSVFGIDFLGPLFRKLLTWCNDQPWFAMRNPQPGRWEKRVFAIFMSLRWGRGVEKHNSECAVSDTPPSLPPASCRSGRP